MPILADFKLRNNQWMSTHYKNGFSYISRMFSIWGAMKQRCSTTPSPFVVKQMPSYINCTTSLEFQDFQYFANWYSSQIGYNLPNYELDKDILVPNNKMYHQDICVLIPQALNLFLVLRQADRGEYPLGVCIDKRTGRFQSHITIDNKLKRLGMHLTAQQAHLSYVEAKEAEAQRWYSRLTSGEFPVDPRVIERMRTWTVASQLPVTPPVSNPSSITFPPSIPLKNPEII